MKPYPHYCAIHRAYYGSPTDTIPATVCPLCGIKAELVAQPAPRAYEVARALSWVDAVESSAAYMPAVSPVALLQSVNHIKKALETYHRLRANKEPAVDALKSIDNAIFNEEHVLNAIAAAAPSPATPEAEGMQSQNEILEPLNELERRYLPIHDHPNCSQSEIKYYEDARWIDGDDFDKARAECWKRLLAFIASPPAARELNLKWGRHDARGEWHIEWHAPCGCAYHPDPKPHIHPCIKHAEIDQCAE